MNLKIDLNCDLGEGLDNEHLLMPFITSCNIACGGHAGSVETMDKVISLALKHQVKIGVHPSFPDRVNFGRQVMEITERQLQDTIEAQLRVFKERAERQNAAVRHVKAHGALYNLIAVNDEKAAVFTKAVRRIFEDVKIYVPFNSAIEKVAQAQGVEIVHEAFADRNYNDDFSLVSRALPEAVILNIEEILAHVKRMVHRQKVKTIQGKELDIQAQTFCVHGDNVNAVKILEELHGEFRLD